jgi:hypothetical protein
VANNAQSDADKDPRHCRLLSDKLGVLLTWSKPAPEASVGPFEPSVFDDFDASRQAIVDACLEKVRTYSDNDLSEIIGSIESMSADVHGWSKFLRDEVNDHKRRVPPWYAGGWGHPDHRADFDYWTKMPKFDLAELTCLSIGISPPEYSKDQLYKLATSKDRPQYWPTVEFLLKRYEQLARRFNFQGRPRSIYPRDFIDWAVQFEFEVHPGFLEPLKRFHLGKHTAEAASAPAAKTDKREIHSIAQLFAAMAIEQFGYDPKQARSPITKEIGDLAAGMGLSISDDTILKYLRIGARHIPDDWKPGKR